MNNLLSYNPDLITVQQPINVWILTDDEVNEIIRQEKERELFMRDFYDEILTSAIDGLFSDSQKKTID